MMSPQESSKNPRRAAGILTAAYKEHRSPQSSRFLITPQQTTGVFLIADAVGSWGNQELATALALQTMMQLIVPSLSTDSDPDSHHDDEQLLRGAVQQTNRALFEENQQRKEDWDAVTSLTAVVIREKEAAVAHVGGSRAYLVPSGGGIRQLTQDHLWITQQIAEGLLPPEAATNPRVPNVIIRSVGAQEQIEVDTLQVSLAVGDVLLLCMHRLAPLVPAEQLEQEVRRSADPFSACEAIVHQAMKQAGALNAGLGVMVLHCS